MNFRKKGIRRSAATAMAVLTAVVSVPFSPALQANALVTDPAGDYDNFAKCLQYSLYFYDANMCGPEVEEHSRFKWRANCHTYDAEVPLKTMDSFTIADGEVGTNLSEAFIKENYDILNTGKKDGTVDVSGGYHDAGDHVKFGLPEAYSGTTVSWGYYEFRDAYIECGEQEHVETIIRHFCDYFMRCTFRDKDGKVKCFCYQVGDGDIDHAYWQLPQNDTMNRPAWFATPENPTTCNVANTAACLLINYLNFKETDPEYAEKCLDYGKALFEFADSNPKAKADTTQGPDAYYTSSKWEDDYCFAACWLYLITGDKKYIDLAMPLVDYYASPSYVYCWNDMWNGVNLLLGIISETYKSDKTFESNPKELTDLAMEYITVNEKSPYEVIDFWGECAKGYCAYMDGKLGKISPQGYFWLDTWGSCRYNTAAQFTMLVYDKYNKGKDKYTEDSHKALPDYSFTEWAKGQMEYILGKNDITYLETGKVKSEDEDGKKEFDTTSASHGPRCFIVGFDEHSAAYPHHRASSGLTKCEDPDQQLYVLFGALAGGPDSNDGHNDITKDWIYNEVTIDYNAACPGAAAGLYLAYKDELADKQKVTPDFPPVNDGGRGSGGENGEGGSNDTYIEACGVDIKQDDGSGVTQISLRAKSSAPKPPKDMKIRYYFNTSEIKDFSLIQAKILYDQVLTETAKEHSGTLSAPVKWEKDPNIAYVELTYDGYNFVNCGKKVQFEIGFYYGDIWDPNNDPSYQDLKVFESNTAFFALDPPEVRNDNICIYDGDKLIGGIEPDGTKPAEDVQTDEPSESKQPTVTPKQAILGDADCSGETDVTDAVLIARFSVGDKVNVTEQGQVNADVNHDAKINGEDLIQIVRSIAGLVTLK
ncbi:MAG: glycoside hydrolase family 9 protein [Oscillospiraceae bacterium]|nr:glycoside hydrolase family 9 protein [Oscillospiraceae bacterium]